MKEEIQLQDHQENYQENYYVYHCPKITEDNRCCDYENRPQICKDFPDNPIAFLPLSCAFSNWKLKSQLFWLKLVSETEIINFLLDGKIAGFNENTFRFKFKRN